MAGDDPDRTIYSPGSGFTPEQPPAAAPAEPSTPPTRAALARLRLHAGPEWSPRVDA